MYMMKGMRADWLRQEGVLKHFIQSLPASHPARLYTKGTVLSSTRLLGNCQTPRSQGSESRSQRSDLRTSAWRRCNNSHSTLPTFRFQQLQNYTDTKSRLLKTQSYGDLQTKLLTDKNKNWPELSQPILSSKNVTGSRGIHKQAEVESLLARYLMALSPKTLVEKAPHALQPYLKLVRFDRPIGTWLLFLPCTWSIGMVAPPGCLPDLYMLAKFGLGAFLMRGAGCTINDMVDKDLDSKVERTRDRPLASNQLSYLQAVGFLGVQLSAALAILLTFNWYSIFLGASSMLLVLVYPFMKRITYWPQITLGLAFNFGTLLGWSAVAGCVEWGLVIPLWASGLAWTMVYDTIYAHQDKEDDLVAGIKSTALKFGDDTKYWLTGFSTSMVSLLTLTGYLAQQTWPYYIGVGAVAGHLAWQVSTVDLNNGESCASKFRSNKNLGLILFAAIVASNLLKKKQKDGDLEVEDSEV